MSIAAVANEAVIEAARAGAMTAGQYSPLNTALLTVAIGLIGLVMKYLVENRKLTIGVNGEVRREFIDEMSALRSEVKGLRDENASLREEVRQLHGIIDGMRRENQSVQLSGQRAIAGAMPHSPELAAALTSLDRLKGTDE